MQPSSFSFRGVVFLLSSFSVSQPALFQISSMLIEGCDVNHILVQFYFTFSCPVLKHMGGRHSHFRYYILWMFRCKKNPCGGGGCGRDLQRFAVQLVGIGWVVFWFDRFARVLYDQNPQSWLVPKALPVNEEASLESAFVGVPLHLW